MSDLPAEPSSLPPGKRPRLLLVDDDRKLSRLLSDFLGSHGFDIAVAHDGSSGLARIVEEPWALVILDLMLPDIDGLRILQAVRKSSSVPILMLTGRGAEEDVVRGLEKGADDYLPKTTSAREMLARVRALLRRAEMSRKQAVGPAVGPESLRVGALHLLPESRQAFLEGAPLTFTPVEFQILESLARHVGRVKTRDQLLDEVRERSYEVQDRSIDVHVASLRRKLGDDPKTPRFIRTVRTLGYLMNDPGQPTG